MGGRLTKKNFAIGLQNTLQSQLKIRIMNLEKPFTAAYHNWLDVRCVSQELIIEKAKLAFVELPTRKVLSEMCPCCFFRKENDWGPDKPWRAGIDGNFQFRRLPHVGETKKTLRQQPVNDIFVKDLPDDNPNRFDLAVKKEDGCPHHFTAVKSMTNSLGKYKGQDQTGLMNFVCEHEICLRLMNLYRGEQFNVTYNLLKSIIDELPDNAYGLLHYDIGCKLGPWLQRVYPDIAERVRVAMNAFHAYAHTISCQMEYGPFRTPLVCLSCGEYTERDWSRKSFIVICCRCSSAIHRESLLTEHSFWHNRIQRSKLGFTLERKYRKALDDQKYHHNEMTKAIPSLTVMAGMESPDDMLGVFQKLASEQVNWIKEKKAGVSAKRSELVPYQRLWKQICYENEIELDYNQAIHRGEDVHIQRTVAKTNQKSKPGPAKFKRWHPSGLCTLQEMRDTAIEQTNKQLYLTPYTREDWAMNTELYRTHLTAFLWECIEFEVEIYQREMAVRAHTYRSIRHHSDLRGTKESGKHYKKLQKAIPSLQRRVGKINELINQLPEGVIKPPLIDMTSFDMLDLEDECNLPIWQYQIAHAEGLQLTQLNLSTQRALNDSFILQGIDSWHKYCRALEQVIACKDQWPRLADWILEKTEQILILWNLPYFMSINGRNLLAQELMHIILTIESALECSNYFADPEKKDKLQS